MVDTRDFFAMSRLKGKSITPRFSNIPIQNKKKKLIFQVDFILSVRFSKVVYFTSAFCLSHAQEWIETRSQENGIIPEKQRRKKEKGKTKHVNL